jgi:hypothetical protein
VNVTLFLLPCHLETKADSPWAGEDNHFVVTKVSRSDRGNTVAFLRGVLCRQEGGKYRANHIASSMPGGPPASTTHNFGRQP